MTLLKLGLSPIKDVTMPGKVTDHSFSSPQGLDLTAAVPQSLAQMAPHNKTLPSQRPVLWTLQLCLLCSVCIWLFLLVAFFLSTVTSGGRLLLFLMVLRTQPLSSKTRLSTQNAG
jgi:hypothetical protein